MAIVEVVKFDGGEGLFAWKYPREDLGTWTQLIVNESQEAILFSGGVALDAFGPGTHTLETANIPILNKIINLPFGGRSPFTAEVWFINKTHSMDIKWGTSTPIQIQDPKYGVFLPVRSFGQFGIKIEDSEKFLVKLVGTMTVFDKVSLLKFFRGLYLMKVKDSISSYLVHRQVGILEINAYLDELSRHMGERIKPELAEYGITMLNFYVNDISIPEEDPAVMKLKQALVKRAEMNIIGYDYQQERSFDTMEGAVKNSGGKASPFIGAGMGIGMGVPLGGVMGQAMSSVTKGLDVEKSIVCGRCEGKVPAGKRFCPDCGHDLHIKTAGRKVQCSKCGASLKPTMKFCPECGDPYNPCPNCGMDVDKTAATCGACGYVMPKKCPGCKSDIVKEAKFCPECGISIVSKCPECNYEVADNAKFCPECGKKL